ncbi:MAG TPA: sigma-70 family RNA polymerase sigma factor [Kofleriaceae bacterium]|nr:sigma-70 family RNA polymerase sigma factor [Kofleriaceae bacterium]
MADEPSLDAIVAAHPAFVVDRDAFAAHVAQVVERTGGVPSTLALEDLYLAFAAAHGDRAAVAELERDVLPVAEPALRVFGADREMVTECLQRVRERVLVGPDRPRLLDYRGQGRLRAWIRVVAVREALMMHRDRKREIGLGDALLASVPDPSDDPELVYLRGEVRDDLPAALETAIKSLAPRERTVLRYSLLDGLSLDEIGAIYQVNKSTVSRWLAAVREKLWRETRAALVERLGDSQDVTSLVRGLQHGLALSLERLLADD